MAVGLIFQLLDYRNGLYGSLYSLFTGKTALNILSEGSLLSIFMYGPVVSSLPVTALYLYCGSVRSGSVPS